MRMCPMHPCTCRLVVLVACMLELSEHGPHASPVQLHQWGDDLAALLALKAGAEA